MLGEFTKAGTEPKMRIAEFQITEDAMYTPGTIRSMLLTSGRKNLITK